MMTEKERLETCIKVVNRMKSVGKRIGRTITKSEALDLKMSLFYARDDEFNKTLTDVVNPGNLNVKELLDCDEFSLVHDVFQIHRYIRKDSCKPDFGTMEGFFVPRCGYEKKEVA